MRPAAAAAGVRSPAATATARRGRVSRPGAHHLRCDANRLRLALSLRRRGCWRTRRIPTRRISARSLRRRAGFAEALPTAGRGWRLTRGTPSAVIRRGRHRRRCTRRRIDRRGTRATPCAAARSGSHAAARRGHGLTAELLHRALLLGKRNPLHRRGRRMAEEPDILGSARRGRHGAVREAQTGGGWSHRQLAAHQTRLANLGTGSARNIVKATLPEIDRRDRGHGVPHPRVTVYVCYIYIRNTHAAIEVRRIAETGIETMAPPGIQRLKRRQRHPADIAKTEADSYAGTKAEERHQAGRPIMPPEAAGIPAPAVRRGIEPSAVVKRSPTPGVVTDPRPTVVVLPDPPPVLIRRPIRSDRGRPNFAIRSVVHPLAVI